LYGVWRRDGFDKHAKDLTKPVLGFWGETYVCSGCGYTNYTEQRTVFNNQAKQKHEVEIATILNPPPIALLEKFDDHPQRFLKRVLAKIVVTFIDDYPILGSRYPCNI
jgi:hypothetical protein